MIITPWLGRQNLVCENISWCKSEIVTALYAVYELQPIPTQLQRET
jgi:hypothetical protein